MSKQLVCNTSNTNSIEQANQPYKTNIPDKQTRQACKEDKHNKTSKQNKQETSKGRPRPILLMAGVGWQETLGPQ